VVQAFMQLHLGMYLQDSTPVALAASFAGASGLERTPGAGRIVLHSIPLLAATCLAGFTLLQVLFHSFS
jgi:hypothetical protein